jgi:hypothetical protein
VRIRTGETDEAAVTPVEVPDDETPAPPMNRP